MVSTMKNSRIAAFLSFVLALAPAARAELGGDADGLRPEAEARGVRYARDYRSGYEAHQLSPGKFVLRQFTGPDRKVFAVAWSGKTHPDLSALMGSHFAEFQQALAQGRAG